MMESADVGVTAGRERSARDSTGADRSADSVAPVDAIESIEQSFAKLFRFVRANMRHSAAALDPDLQPATWNVLRQIVREGPSQAGSLAASSGMDKSAVSRHLRELRERGLIITEPSPDDARVVIVRPTPEATERVTAVTEASGLRYRRFLDTWSADELDDFARLLGRFSDIDRFGEHP